MFREMHSEDMRVVLHVLGVPHDLHGRVMDHSHDPDDAANYWRDHLDVFHTGIDGWWVDDGDELPMNRAYPAIECIGKVRCATSERQAIFTSTKRLCRVTAVWMVVVRRRRFKMAHVANSDSSGAQCAKRYSILGNRYGRVLFNEGAYCRVICTLVPI